MKLLTKALRNKLPKLYAQEKLGDEAIVYCKLFTPDSNWTWWVLEFDGQDTFFGLVQGFEREFGYFSLKEISEARGPMGLHVERDKWFKPCKVKDIK